MKKKLFKSLLAIIILLVAFFSLFNNSYAASFAYNEFNWAQFLEKNKDYWSSVCEDGDENCYDYLIKQQEKFYKRLYFLLYKFQLKGYTIDDNIIIETVFYGLTPSSFKDPKGDINDPFNLDVENDTSYIADADESARDYFEKETDSLKTLMNNMIGYTQKCYGISDSKPYKNDKDQTVCSGNLQVMGSECVAELDTLESSFFASIGITQLFGGNKVNEEKCKELAEGYSGYQLGKVSSKPEVNEDLYWDFLKYSDYFDRKSHLQSNFSRILGMTGKEKMTDLSDGEYIKYEKDIISVREMIIENIKSVLKSLGKDKSLVSMTSSSGQLSKYWWPIGGTETSENDGVIMASGEPESLNVINQYGLITMNGVPETKHNGIDISGTDNLTNVIATREGTVISIIDGQGGKCAVDDTSCGGGYGNFVIIQHVDNNYSLYANLATDSIKVKSGDVVKQGQVIGLVGQTGEAKTPQLHFEIRVGGNDVNSTQDPLLFIDAENPRATGVGSDLLEWIGVMEGTGPMQGDNYKVYNDSGGVATFGHGITVMYNKDVIRSYGIEPNTLYVGSLVPKTVADNMYADIVQSSMDYIKGEASSKGVTLNDNQLAAVVSLYFNTGRLSQFFDNYSKYGSSENLCTNWWEKFCLRDANGTYLDGLRKRRVAECDAFVTGVYNMNPYG